MTSLRIEGDRRTCPTGVVIARDDKGGIWAMRAIAIDRNFVIEGWSAEVDFHKFVENESANCGLFVGRRWIKSKANQ